MAGVQLDMMPSKNRIQCRISLVIFSTSFSVVGSNTFTSTHPCTIATISFRSSRISCAVVRASGIASAS